MISKLALDPRVDPRIKAMLGDAPQPPKLGDVRDRLELLAEANTEAAQAALAQMKMMLDALDTEAVASFKGLLTRTVDFTSEPDGNRIHIQFIRPEGNERLPCVYYIHGGGMQSLSAFDGMYRAWGRLIAGHGVAVAMVDFRNCLTPSSAPEIEPYPAGLNDCVSGVKWITGNHGPLGIDPARIVIAGDSGGGNLTLATGMKLKRDGDIGLVKGLFALCPYIAGMWPDARYPSSIENNGILLELHNNRSAMAYGIEAFEAQDPLAWPAFAGIDDVIGLPPTVISVNECDPLRDEGIAFAELLARAGVEARCRQLPGTIHAVELLGACPDISRETARELADFCRQ
jgi:acetyl esterase/lipase